VVAGLPPLRLDLGVGEPSRTGTGSGNPLALRRKLNVWYFRQPGICASSTICARHYFLGHLEDGKKIVFQSNRDGNTEIYTMNADGTGRTRLANYPGRDQDPEWSPDGRTIAFERDAAPIADQTFQVFVMNADGTDPTQLTGLQLPSDPSENGHPGWGRGPAADTRR
jgi:tricorn protease-like protein